MRPAAARAVLGRRAFGAPGPRISGLSISGTAGVGEVLTATTPTVEGDGPFTYAWAWLRDGTPIAGASGTTEAPSTYTQVVADAAANTDDPRRALSIRYAVTDANGRVRTKISNAIAGPALAADDAVSVSADGPAATGNVLTNDPTGSATVTAVAVGVQSVTVGVATALTGGGTLTVEAAGAFTFDPDGGFGSLIIGDTEAVEIEITRSDGGAQRLTVTVLGTAELAYVVDPANITTAENPESWLWTGGETITLLEADGEFPPAITTGDLGIRRAVLNGVATWRRGYTEAPLLAAAAPYVAFAPDDPAGSGEVSAALSELGNGLVFDYTGGNLRATLTDDNGFSASVSIAMPSSGSFMGGCTVNTEAGILGISVTTSDSTAAVAVTTSIAGYVPVTLATLRFGRFAGKCYYGTLLAAAFVSAARLQTDLAHASRAGTYHNAAPAFTAPGGLSLADAQTDATLDVSSGLSGGEAPITWAVSSITGDWDFVTIDSSGVITADTDDLTEDGTAGALVTVTDARGLSDSDTISVAITADAIAQAFTAYNGLDLNAGNAASITHSSNAVSTWADQSGDGRDATNALAAGTKPTWDEAGGYVSADGGDRMNIAWNGQIVGTKGLTIFAALRYGTQTSSFGRVLDFRGTGVPGASAGWVIYASGDATPLLEFVVDDGAGNAAVVSYTGFSAGTDILTAWRYDAATGEAELLHPAALTNTDAGLAGKTITGTTMGRLFLDANASPAGRYWVGRGYRFLVLDDALPDAEINLIGAQIAAEAGLTWSGI